MSFFGPTIKYSQTEHYLSEVEIKKLVSRFTIQTLTAGEEGAAEKAILVRRGNDGKISLQQIYEALLSLFHQRQISRYDFDGLMKVFEEYCKHHFST